MRPSTSERLLARLRCTLPFTIPERIELRRTRAGWHQKSAGGWAWYACYPDGREFSLGSSDTMTDCLKAKELGWHAAHGDCHVSAD